jgi:hypothetical protein
MGDLQPSFDSVIDIVSFKLSDPMKYKSTSESAVLTAAGVTWSGSAAHPVVSSSSSDDEFIPPGKHKKQ